MLVAHDVTYDASAVVKAKNCVHNVYYTKTKLGS